MKAHFSRTIPRLPSARGRIPFFLPAIVLLSCLAISSLTLADLPKVTPQEAGVQAGPPPALTIFSTSEVTGWTEPCG